MIKRILCSIIGHVEWRGMGWLGTTQWGDFIHKQQCRRCGIVVYNIEPNWHLRARYNTMIDVFDVPIIEPNKHSLNSSEYNEQLKEINRKYPIDVLSDIHKTTIEELEKIGY